MKKCPQCQRTFDDTMNFCQFDAVPLVAAESEDNLPPTVVGFQLPPTQAVGNGQFEKPTHPQMPAFQTNQPTPQFQPHQPNPQFRSHQNNQSYQQNQPNQQNFNPQFSFPGAAAQPDRSGKRPGNRWAMASLGFMIAACVLTFIALVRDVFFSLAMSLSGGGFTLHSLFAVITILVTIVALGFAALALFLRMTKPDYYGRKNSAISVLLISIILLGIQLISTAKNYSEASGYKPGYNSGTNYGTNTNSGTNTSVNRPANIAATPVPLQTAIIGTWRDSVGATASFYANKTLVINDKTGKKIADADYEITGTDKLTMKKNGVRVKEYTVTVSGNRMTMDGETMTKVY